jgi:hypothetical protein
MTGEGLVAGEAGEAIEVESSAASDSAPASDDGEFKITVRKLELPVRPRGVLAE